jgi:hypothetical protein
MHRLRLNGLACHPAGDDCADGPWWLWPGSAQWLPVGPHQQAAVAGAAAAMTGHQAKVSQGLEHFHGFGQARGFDNMREVAIRVLDAYAYGPGWAPSSSAGCRRDKRSRRRRSSAQAGKVISLSNSADTRARDLEL